MDRMTWLRTHWDRVAAWAAIVVGVVVLLLGWNGASDTPFPAEQLPYILSGGIGGALLVALGAALLISADLRDEWHVLDRIERALRDRDADHEPLPAVTETAAPASADDRTAKGNGVAPARARRGRATTDIEP
jgi:hypothetical protein